MRVMTLVMALMVGCVDVSTDEVVEQCRSDAEATCEAIGYGGNKVCFLTFAQGCSPEDAEAARIECVRADTLPSDADCRLTWR